MLTLDVAHTSLGLHHSRFGLSQIVQNDVLPFGHLVLLLIEGCLNLERHSLALFCLLLVRNHAAQLFVRLRIFLLQLRLLLGKAATKVADLVDRIPQFLQTDIQVSLLFFNILALFIEQFHILGNKVKVMAGSEECSPTLLLLQTLVELLQRIVDVNH